MYLIDGHNLIPKVSGLSLSDPDDEHQLVQQLVRFCQRGRTKAIVFFDQAVNTTLKSVKSGAITIYFVPNSSTADHAIHAYLQAHRREASNFTVVSSDWQVVADSHSMKAGVMSSEEFAEKMQYVLLSSGKMPNQEEPKLSDEEIEEWEKLFLGYNK